MPILLLLAAAAGLLMYERSKSSTSTTAATSGMLALVTDAATVQSAQHLVNQLLPELNLSTTPNAEDGNPKSAGFVGNLALIQGYINGINGSRTDVSSTLSQAGIPMPLRVDGVLDVATNKALDIAASFG